MSQILFVEYPRCTTCRKAKKWLDEHGVDYIDRNIVDENPNAAELTAWHALSGLSIRRFFNTSGMLYREQRVKELLDSGITDTQAIEVLSKHGMLVKRPIVVGEDFVLVGFKEAEWTERLA